MMKHDNSNHNPWAGLSSYEDPAKSEQKLKFCGRDNETKEVARLIDDNFFVTLYGKSGIGKTSLLNAGVFPTLRREQYTPLSLRLGITEETSSFQDIITQSIERAIEEIGGSVHIVNVMDEQTEQDATDYFWCWFARRRFLSANGQITFPVLVFDQFEEVFRHNDSRRKTTILLEQLNFLIDESHAVGDCVVDGEQYNYDFNFRFVLSIREDDLYRLEDTLDNCVLSALKRCRYRLRSLSEEGAHKAILIPGEGLFKEEEKNQIVQTIIGIARNKEDNSISTNLLSLVCNRLYVESQKAGSSSISLPLVDSFVKGNPFERFYNEATRGFSNKEKSYIEEHLVDSTGRRNSIPESDFLVHVKNGLKLIEGKNHILQRVSTSSDGGNFRIELIHDSFCEPIIGMKNKRFLKKRVMMVLLISLVLLLCGSILIIIRNQYTQNWKLMKAESRYIATLAEKMLDEDNTYLAQRLLLEAMPDSIDSSHRPYVVEVGNALVRAYDSNVAIIDKAAKLYSRISPDGLSIITANEMGVNRWDAYTGKLIQTIAPPNEIKCNNVDCSPKGTIIVFTSAFDGRTVVWDCKKNEALVDFYTHDADSRSFLSNDSSMLFTIDDSTFYVRYLYKVETVVKRNHLSVVCFVKEIKNGKWILSASNDGIINIWDTKTMNLIKSFPINGTPIKISENGNYIISRNSGKTNIYHLYSKALKTRVDYDYQICNELITDKCYFFSKEDTINMLDLQTNKQTCFSMNSWEYTKENNPWVEALAVNQEGTILASSYRDGSIILWDIKTRTILRKLALKDSYANELQFSTDSNLLLSCSPDGICKILNVKEIIKSSIYEKLLSGIPESYGPKVFAFNPNVKSLAYSLGESIIIQVPGIAKYKLLGHSSYINSLDFSSDGSLLVSTSKDATIKIWNATNGLLIKTFKRWGRMNVWDSENNKSICLFDKYQKIFMDAYFCSNGQEFITESYDGIITKWNIKTGKGVDIFKGCNPIRASRQERIFYMAKDSTLNIWDSKAKKLICHLENDVSSPCHVAFSNDDKYVAALMDNRTIRVWNPSNGKVLMSFETPDAIRTHPITFSPTGEQIVYGSDHGGFRHVNIYNIQNLMNETRQSFGKIKLTENEKKMFHLQ